MGYLDSTRMVGPYKYTYTVRTVQVCVYGPDRTSMRITHMVWNIIFKSKDSYLDLKFQISFIMQLICLVLLIIILITTKSAMLFSIYYSSFYLIYPSCNSCNQTLLIKHIIVLKRICKTANR